MTAGGYIWTAGHMTRSYARDVAGVVRMAGGAVGRMTAIYVRHMLALVRGAVRYRAHAALHTAHPSRIAWLFGDYGRTRYCQVCGRQERRVAYTTRRSRAVYRWRYVDPERWPR